MLKPSNFRNILFGDGETSFKISIDNYRDTGEMPQVQFLMLSAE
jgi:hypothetical protein